MSSLPRARSVAVASLSLAIAVAVVGWGGVEPSAQLGVLAAGCAALLAVTFVADASPRAPPLVLALGVALAVTALQLVPLPPAVLGAVSPGARDVAEVGLAPLGLYPSARPTTLDVPATAGEVGKAAALLCAAVAAVSLGSSRRSRDRLIAAVSAAGVAALAVLGGRALFGDAPLLASGGPFVNASHLSALLALAGWPALGRGLRERGRARVAWLAVFVGASAGTFLTLSRAGIASFFVAAGVFGLLHARREAAARDPAAGQRRADWARHAALPVATALVLAIAAYAGLERILEEMRSVSRVASDPRVEVWPAAVELLASHPLIGVGRGAFGVAFAGHQRPAADPLTYAYAENEWLQLPVDLGIPVGLGIVTALAWTWLSAARRRHLSRVEIGALAGTAAVATHAAFDFALELPGVAVPFVVLLGVLQARAAGRPLRARALRAAAVGLGVAGAAGIAFAAAHPPEEGDALHAATVDELSGRAGALAALRPADFLPHATVGIRLVQAGRCAEAMPWLVRAMWLAPTVPATHRYAGRCLAAAGQDVSARREYRLALTLGDPEALEEGVRRWSGADALSQLVPETAEALRRLAHVLDRAGRGAEATDVLRRGWESLSDPDLLFGLGEAAVREGDPGRALEVARDLRSREPARARSWVLASRALSALGDAEGALRELESGLVVLPGAPELVLALGAELIRQNRFANAVVVLTAGAWRSADAAARARDMRITALRAQGRLPEAIAEARTARELDSRNPAAALRLADLLADAGLVDEAVGVLAGAAALPGSGEEVIADRLRRIRRRAPAHGAAR
jgi:Flp pilus assembly protein TadD